MMTKPATTLADVVRDLLDRGFETLQAEGQTPGVGSPSLSAVADAQSPRPALPPESSVNGFDPDA